MSQNLIESVVLIGAGSLLVILNRRLGNMYSHSYGKIATWLVGPPPERPQVAWLAVGVFIILVGLAALFWGTAWLVSDRSFVTLSAIVFGVLGHTAWESRLSKRARFGLLSLPILVAAGFYALYMLVTVGKHIPAGTLVLSIMLGLVIGAVLSHSQRPRNE